MGGPMMGVAVSNLDISIVKGTSGIVVFTKRKRKKVRKYIPVSNVGLA
jgi:electron transport complex protein RnfC